MSARRCLLCSCTETNACVDERGPCGWAAEKICTHCAEDAPLRCTVLAYTDGRSEIGMTGLFEAAVNADVSVGEWDNVDLILTTEGWVRDGWLPVGEGKTARWVRRHMA